MSSRLDQRIRRVSGAEVNAASLLVDWSRPVAGHAGMPKAPDPVGEAHRAGYDAGYEAATQEMQAAEVAARSAQLRRIADALTMTAEQISRTRHEAVAMGVTDVIELAYQLTEAFLQRELALGRPITETVARAMRLVPEGHDLVVRFHPGDPIDAEELIAMVPDVSVNVVTDPSVEAGGCVVTAGSCRVDTQLAPALARARQVLAELYPDAHSSGDEYPVPDVGGVGTGAGSAGTGDRA